MVAPSRALWACAVTWDSPEAGFPCELRKGNIETGLRVKFASDSSSSTVKAVANEGSVDKDWLLERSPVIVSAWGCDSRVSVLPDDAGGRKSRERL